MPPTGRNAASPRSEGVEHFLSTQTVLRALILIPVAAFFYVVDWTGTADVLVDFFQWILQNQYTHHYLN